MALIKCPECSAEISDKASCCPKCGAPVIVHRWRCSKCGNVITKEPCPHCSNIQTVANTTAASHANSTGATPVFVQKNKRNLGIITTTLVIVIIGLIVTATTLQNSGSSKKTLDPNRTIEDCPFFGTAKVYGTAHQINVNCFQDGDGWYNVSFGHHHHK